MAKPARAGFPFARAWTTDTLNTLNALKLLSVFSPLSASVVPTCLGSTSLLTNASGGEVPDSALHYFPYGATRAGDPAALPTT